jgi:hypothetical protein
LLRDQFINHQVGMASKISDLKMSVYFHAILTVYRDSVNGFKSSTNRHIQTQIITVQGLSVLIGKESYNLLSNGKHKMCAIQ